MEWQPIETAPKDGSVVLTFSMDAHLEPTVSQLGLHWTPVMAMAWLMEEFLPVDEFGDFHFTNGYAPTHWMPLPAPPKQD